MATLEDVRILLAAISTTVLDEEGYRNALLQTLLLIAEASIELNQVMKNFLDMAKSAERSTPEMISQNEII